MRSYTIRMIGEVLQRILPQNIVSALDKLTFDKLYEVRLRSGKAVAVGYGGRYGYLSPCGMSDSIRHAIVTDGETLQRIVLRACDKSLYAVNDRICRGYLTLEGGIRMGVAGETVFEGESIRTVKNFTALNFRIPHEAVGCAELLLPYVKGTGGYLSTLVISPPGAGKTTLLRDMARIAASDKLLYNVLIADERDELASVHGGVAMLNVGNNADVVSGCNKEYAFSCAIRALRPDIIVTDELCDEHDTAAVEHAIGSGVCVFASVHADSHLRLPEKQAFCSLLRNKCFCRYIDVSSARGPGTIEGVFDENFRLLRAGEGA